MISFHIENMSAYINPKFQIHPLLLTQILKQFVIWFIVKVKNNRLWYLSLFQFRNHHYLKPKRKLEYIFRVVFHNFLLMTTSPSPLVHWPFQIHIHHIQYIYYTENPSPVQYKLALSLNNFIHIFVSAILRTHPSWIYSFVVS